MSVERDRERDRESEKEKKQTRERMKRVSIVGKEKAVKSDEYTLFFDCFNTFHSKSIYSINTHTPLYNPAGRFCIAGFCVTAVLHPAVVASLLCMCVGQTPALSQIDTQTCSSSNIHDTETLMLPGHYATYPNFTPCTLLWLRATQSLPKS